ncbi:lysophospholipid acyltransferase family protein [Mycolicibacterium sp.]|uniref:lysophospholipid acyltransferase family protein n=1 Tax=Mycolicibacterium sp. TaxID=2320850 RepID=UPI001A2F6A4B|nr:lysophospholipid acyltransferase family protein [Mycolicibacterium sp.]MBJ7341882.1 acyltransferase family protein [Mycolicibacterium sp.]
MKLIPVSTYQRWIENVADRIDPVVSASKPYIDGLEDLPRDGRFLLVGNHTQAGTEALLVPYVVRRQIGIRVRPLADRRFGNVKGVPADLFAAAGAVIGSPDTARELMRADEPILVFPGGSREISKAKDQLYELMWKGRNGFARLAVENDYPIIPVALVGGDDVYHVMTTSDGRWARWTKPLATRLTGDPNVAMPLMRGIGPTMIPRPQRMYLRFGTLIDTARPKRVAAETWVETVRMRVKSALEADLAALLEIRADDPYRQLAPWARGAAVAP